MIGPLQRLGRILFAVAAAAVVLVGVGLVVAIGWLVYKVGRGWGGAS